jgi:transposase
VAERADWLRRMQKCLDQMNVRVHRAVSQLDGVTGMKMVREIVRGERDPRQLAKLRDPGCQKNEDAMAEELSGHWREDHLFGLAQALKMYDSIEERLGEYEREILRRMEALKCEKAQGMEVPVVQKREKAKSIQRRKQEPARRALFGMTGIDGTAIDGVGVETMEAVISEYGSTLEKFRNEDAFVSHLRLAPHMNVTGGKPIRKKRRSRASSTRVGNVLRTAAVTLEKTSTELGAYFRSMARRKDRAVAVFATARRLAILIYRALRWGQEYVDRGAAAYEQRTIEIRMRNLTRNAAQMGYALVPQTAASTAV